MSNFPDLPPARLRKTEAPTLDPPEAVQLVGIIAAENLGGYEFSYGMGQLMVAVYKSNPPLGGSYAVGALPMGEWFVLTDRSGFLLPVAVTRLQQDAFQIRVDPAPLQGLRNITSMPGY